MQRLYFDSIFFDGKHARAVIAAWDADDGLVGLAVPDRHGDPSEIAMHFSWDEWSALVAFIAAQYTANSEEEEGDDEILSQE